MHITERIHMVSDARETVNSVFVTSERGTVVIDTMRTPADGELLLQHVNSHTAKPVIFVVNTHFHADHTFGNTAFSAPIAATETTRELMEAKLQSSWSALSEDIIPMPLPSLTFTDELTLHLPTKTIHFREVGGHAPGTVVTYIPEASAIYTSDLVFGGRIPFMADANIPLWIEALEDLEDLDVEHVIPGHGVPGGSELLRDQRQWLEHFYARAVDLLDEGTSPRQAAQELADEFDAPPERLDMFCKVITDMQE